MALPAMPDALWQVLLDDLQAQGRIARNGPWLHLPGHAATLSDDETALAGALLPLLAEGRYDPPWVRDLRACAASRKSACGCYCASCCGVARWRRW